MKKSLSVFLAMLMLFSVFAWSVSASDGKTTADYRYENKFRSARAFYNDFAIISEKYCPVPGLVNTDVAGDSCSAMTPQGICVTEDYIFISAYCNIKKYKTELEENKDYGTNSEKLEREADHKTHNSVIYIIDRESGEYIKNMVLPDANHVGGLATDGKVIFVAKSADKQVSVIKLTQVERVLNTKSLSVKVKYDFTVDCGCTASFVTYHDGYLWVGVFNEKNNGELNAFTVNSKDYELTEKYSLEIPAKANGACFTEIDGETCLAVNTSYGRKNVSQVYLFSVSDYATGKMVINEKSRYIAPPLIQNCCIYDGKVYNIFESAASCYSEVEADLGMKSTRCAVDRVCIGDENKLFNWHCEENIFALRIKTFINAVSEFFSSLIG
ncbi:MAG: hypothetical protein IKJ27_04305 [Clostridia bacterium]|nr:hypothetical protein [Clostridia bacterium]